MEAFAAALTDQLQTARARFIEANRVYVEMARPRTKDDEGWSKLDDAQAVVQRLKEDVADLTRHIKDLCTEEAAAGAATPGGAGVVKQERIRWPVGELPRFKVDTDLETFFQETEAILRVYEIPEAKWTSALVVQTSSAARRWAAKELVSKGVPWNEAKRQLTARYGAADRRERKLERLMGLAQGKASVVEFSEKVEEAAKDAGLDLDDQMVVHLFKGRLEKGLAKELRLFLGADQANQTFREIVSAAVQVEAGRGSGRGSDFVTSPPGPGCYTCGSADHRKRDCPDRHRQGSERGGGSGTSSGGRVPNATTGGGRQSDSSRGDDRRDRNGPASSSGSARGSGRGQGPGQVNRIYTDLEFLNDDGGGVADERGVERSEEGE